MFKKYNCTNDDGSYDAYNSCYLHDDKKGFNYFLENNAGTEISIFARTKENEEGEFESNIQVRQRDSNKIESEHNVTFTTGGPVNMEIIYQDFEDEFTEGSNKNWNEIFEDYAALVFPEKVEGIITNSNIWNELKNEYNVDLQIMKNWDYNGWGNSSDHYIKNEKENIIFHSENRNDFNYVERNVPHSDGKIEIEYEGYDDTFKIEIDKNNNISFNELAPKKMIEKNVVEISGKDTFEKNSEKIEYFIKGILRRAPITQISTKATELFRKSLRKAAKKVAKQNEVKSNKNVRS
jgi:hypothetical protein